VISAVLLAFLAPRDCLHPPADHADHWLFKYGFAILEHVAHGEPGAPCSRTSCSVSWRSSVDTGTRLRGGYLALHISMSLQAQSRRY